MKDVLRQLLSQLTELDAPPGFEQPVVAFLAERFGEAGATVKVDAMGNLYAELGQPDAQPHLMIAAHSDEIAGMVRHIDARGFIRIEPLGGLVAAYLVAQRVRVAGHLGVVGISPGHFLSSEERQRVPPMEELYIDVGAESAEEVAQLGIRIGSTVTYYAPLLPYSNSDRVTGKAIDNRIGCAVLLQLFRELEATIIEGCLTGLVAVQEEVGLRGAMVGARQAAPDYAVVIDTLAVADTPGIHVERHVASIGEGPVLVIASAGGRTGRGHIAHGKVQRWLEEAANRAEVPVQLATSIGWAVTDAAAIHLTGRGVPTGVLGLPRRYSHSPICTFDLNDAAAAVRLLKAFVSRMSVQTDLSFI